MYKLNTISPGKFILFIILACPLLLTNCKSSSGPDEPDAAIELGGKISSDSTLTDIFEDSTKADYIVVSNLDIRAKLTVDPGVVIKSEDNVQIYINENDGVIVAEGNADNKIVFTGVNSVPGAWRGLYISSKSVENTMKYVDIRYGGSSDAGTFDDKANLTISYAKLDLSYVSFTGSDGNGFQTSDDESSFTMDECSFDNNAKSDMYIESKQLAFIDNQSNFNGGTVEVIEGDTRNDGSVTWSNLNNGKYFFAGNVSIDNTVEIEAGAVFEFNTDTRLNVDGDNGVIKAVGTASDPIVFTGKAKAKGAWRGILVNSKSVENIMDHVKIEYGGSSNMSTFTGKANLGVNTGAKLTLKNSSIENSDKYGIIAKITRGSVLTTENVSYKNNTAANLFDPYE